MLAYLLTLLSLFTPPKTNFETERPFPQMEIFQEWKCDSFLFEPKRSHWHNMVWKSAKSKMIAPSFYSAIDTIPTLIDGKAYFRYWPFLVPKTNYDSLILHTPKIDSTYVPFDLNGINSFAYYFIRQEEEKILFINPYYLEAHKFLIENANNEERDEFSYEVALESSKEQLFWDISDRKVDADSSYLELGRLKNIYLDERSNKEVFVLRNDRIIHKYNICVDEFEMTKEQGIISIKLYNTVIDDTQGKRKTFRQECECKLKK